MLDQYNADVENSCSSIFFFFKLHSYVHKGSNQRVKSGGSRGPIRMNLWVSLPIEKRQTEEKEKDGEKSGKTTNATVFFWD